MMHAVNRHSDPLDLNGTRQVNVETRRYIKVLMRIFASIAPSPCPLPQNGGEGWGEGARTGKYHFETVNKWPPGFTLLEILITLLIFSILASTLFVSFNTLLSSAGAIDTDASDYEMGKNCLDRMLLDLTAIHVSRPPEYRVPDIDDPPDPFRILGDFSQAGESTFGRLRFAALSHLPLDRRPDGGIAQIVYYVQEAEDQTYELRRQDMLEPYPEVEERASDPILCRKVRSLSFTYYTAEGEEFESWDSESKEYDRSTPVAVKILLSFGQDSNPLTFGTMVQLPVNREKVP